MTAYDRLRAEALEALGPTLTQKGFEPDQRAHVLDLISHLNFPAFLALLGTSGQTGGGLGQPLLHTAARGLAGTAPVKQLHLGADDVERALRAVFVHGAPPDAALADPAARDVVLPAALDQLGTQVGIPITPDEASEGDPSALHGCVLRRSRLDRNGKGRLLAALQQIAASHG
jgi:hypothetical protein